MGFNLNYQSSNFGISYGNNPFYDFFSFGSLEEVIIFFVVFLIGFTVSYTGLKKFFTVEKSSGPNKLTGRWENGGKFVENKKAVIVISLCIALLMAFGIMRSGWLFYYFGDIAGIVFSVMVMLIIIIILIPFYKAFENAVGKLIAGILMGPAIWFVLMMVGPYLTFIQNTNFLNDLYSYLVSAWGLVALFFFFLLVGLVRHKSD
jgi:hypothetical protein